MGPEGGHYLANALQNNKILEHLKVNQCGLGDEGFSPIACGIMFCNCDCASVDQSLVCVALASNRSLSVLESGDNNITDEGAQSLSEALKLNTTLEGISLWHNLIKSHV